MEEVRLTVRIPKDIAAEIRRIAKERDRSFNGEIVRALRRHVERENTILGLTVDEINDIREARGLPRLTWEGFDNG